MNESIPRAENTETQSEAEKFAELKVLFQQKRKQGGFEFLNKIKPFIDSLTQEFSRAELEKTQLFNLVSGSGPPHDASFVFTEFDLPGGEIEKFIRK
jgi:hypothetical protein